MQIRTCCIWTLAALSASTWAAPIIDQNQAVADTPISSLGQPLVQSFTTQAPNVAGAGIFVGNRPGYTGTATTVTITLWDELPNAGGTALATASGTAKTDTWLDVFFGPVTVTANEDYFLTFDAGLGSGLAIMGSIANKYANGKVFAGPNYDDFPEYDYAFRTYTNASVTQNVPEPSSMALVGLGVLAAGAACRRRKG